MDILIIEINASETHKIVSQIMFDIYIKNFYNDERSRASAEEKSKVI